MSAINVEQILEVIKKANLVTDVNTLSVDRPLSQQGIDSLDFSGILFNIEEAFSVEIPDAALDEIKSINDIVAYLERH